MCLTCSELTQMNTLNLQLLLHLADIDRIHANWRRNNDELSNPIPVSPGLAKSTGHTSIHLRCPVYPRDIASWTYKCNSLHFFVNSFSPYLVYACVLQYTSSYSCVEYLSYILHNPKEEVVPVSRSIPII